MHRPGARIHLRRHTRMPIRQIAGAVGKDRTLRALLPARCALSYRLARSPHRGCPGLPKQLFDENSFPEFGLAILGVPLVMYLWALAGRRLWLRAQEAPA